MKTVRDCMTRRVATINADASIRVAIDAFNAHAFHHLPVVNDAHEPIGILSDRDILRESLKGTLEPTCKAHTIMTTFLAKISPDIALREAAKRLIDLNLNCLLVTQGERLVGILTTRDIAAAVARGDA